MASPLSTIYKAFQQRTSASFHLGLCAMGLVTSTMWVIFALVSTHSSQCMSNPYIHTEMKQVAWMPPCSSAVHIHPGWTLQRRSHA